MKSLDKKVSVLIPCYNVEKFVKKCINSIILQTYQNIEIIVIDDGSKDNTLSILKEIERKDKRIKVISKENTGVSDTRNIAMEYATGDYIMFVDADDWIEENAIESLLQVAIEKNAEVVRGKYIQKINDVEIREADYIKASVIETYEQKRKVLEQIVNAQMQAYCVLLLLKRKFLQKNQIKFNKEVMFLEDRLFYTDLLIKCNRFVQIDQYIYYYNINEESVVQSQYNIIRKFNSIKIVYFETKKNLMDNGYWDNFINVELDTSFFNFLTNFIINIYISSKNPFEEVKEILNDKTLLEYIKMVDQTKIPIKERITCILIKNKNYKLLNIYYVLRKIKYNIKNRQMKEENK